MSSNNYTQTFSSQKTLHKVQTIGLLSIFLYFVEFKTYEIIQKNWGNNRERNHNA